ncbi:MAG: SPOR domain-containing protein [Bacteroidales bacterium]|nr:SPOR domain-containing protein [Bacteroidales bacterium]
MPTDYEVAERKAKAQRDSIEAINKYFEEEAFAKLIEESEGFDVMGQDEPSLSTTQNWLSTTTSVSTNTGDRFHVVVGSFRVPENAARMIRRLSDRGYQPVELRLDGYVVVSAGSYASYPEARTAMQRMQSTDPSLCPPDPYVFELKK